MNSFGTLLHFLGLLSTQQNITTTTTTNNNNIDDINNNITGPQQQQLLLWDHRMHSFKPVTTTKAEQQKPTISSKVLSLSELNTIGKGGEEEKDPFQDLSFQDLPRPSKKPSKAFQDLSHNTRLRSKLVTGIADLLTTTATTSTSSGPSSAHEPLAAQQDDRQKQDTQSNNNPHSSIRRQTKYQNFIIDPTNSAYSSAASVRDDLARPQNAGGDLYAQPPDAKPRLPPNSAFVNNAENGLFAGGLGGNNAAAAATAFGSVRQPTGFQPSQQYPNQYSQSGFQQQQQQQYPNQYVQGFQQQQQQFQNQYVQGFQQYSNQYAQQQQQQQVPNQYAAQGLPHHPMGTNQGGGIVLPSTVFGATRVQGGVTYVQIPSRPGLYTINPVDGSYQMQPTTNDLMQPYGFPHGGNQGQQFGAPNPYSSFGETGVMNRNSGGGQQQQQPLPPPTQYSTLYGNQGINGNDNFLPGIRGNAYQPYSPETERDRMGNRRNKTSSQSSTKNTKMGNTNPFRPNPNIPLGPPNPNNQFGPNPNNQFGPNPNNQFGPNPYSQFGSNPNSQSGPNQPPTIIPRSVLYKDPEHEYTRLSPDGRYVAFLSTAYGVQNVHVMDLTDFLRSNRLSSPARTVTKETERSIAGFEWLYDNRTIVYAKDSGGTEDYQLVAVDISAGTIRNLTQGDKVKANIEMISPKRPYEILISLNDRNPVYFDLYVLDVRTGRRQLLYRNDRFAELWTDWDYNLRLGGDNYYTTSNDNTQGTANGMNPDNSNINDNIYSDEDMTDSESSQQPQLDSLYRQIRAEDAQETYPDSFDLSGRNLYWMDRTNRDKSAFIRTDFKGKTATVLVQPKQSDVSSALYDPRTFEPWAVTIAYDRIQYYPVGRRDIIGDLNYLNGIGSQFIVESVTADGTQWLIMFFDDVTPGKYYLYDRRSRKTRFLFSKNADIERYQLARTRPVQIRARDGLQMMAYLTLPSEADPQNLGRPSSPLPAVLLVHGGPASRDFCAYSALVQQLANRGYAVMQPNYRGSSGFGKQFEAAGDLEWGKKMQTDLVDAVGFMVQNGIAQADRVAIVGGSYGGYATLAGAKRRQNFLSCMGAPRQSDSHMARPYWRGLAFTPDLFACGVDIVGPSNLQTLVDSVPEYWKPITASLKKKLGDWDTAQGQELLREASPLFKVDRIKKPLLIGQGANDPRVKQAESDQIVTAMRENGLPVTYLLFPDEGHGFSNDENNMAFFAVADVFLKKCLGGRAEDIGNVSESSMIIMEPGDLKELQ